MGRSKVKEEELEEEDFITNQIKAADEAILNVEKADLLWKAFLGKTNIERVKAEGLVINMLVNGHSKKEIIDKLKSKYPKYDFNYTDLNKFIVRHDEIVQYLEDDTKKTARRHLSAKHQIEEALSSLAKYCQRRIVELRDEGDTTSETKMIKTFNQTIKNLMDLKKLGKEDSPQSVINIISEKYQDFEDDIHAADFKLSNE